MEVVQIKNTRFEDLLDEVYKLEKHLKEIDAKISSTKIEYIPMNKVLKTLDISRKTADYTKAIELKPNYTGPYTNRGIAKNFLNQDYCPDFKKACELGNCENYNKGCK